MAQKDGVSLSTKVRDLLKEAMEIQEDLFGADIAGKEKTLWLPNKLYHMKIRGYHV